MAPVLLSTTRCATALSCYLMISMFLLVCQGAALLCFWLYFGYLLLFFLSWTSSISFFLLKVVFPILKHFLFRWISLPAPKELTTTLGLSQSACEMFLVLKDHLCTMDPVSSANCSLIGSGIACPGTLMNFYLRR